MPQAAWYPDPVASNPDGDWTTTGAFDGALNSIKVG